MKKILVIGYGNPDREDDGVAWHVLQKLSVHFDSPVLELDGREVEPPLNPHLVCVLQLTPEMAETLALFDLVCFVDAHTGAYAEEIRVTPVKPGYQASPFTHHLTPETCLELAKKLYDHAPAGLVVSIRGYHFGYRPELSAQTAVLVEPAVNRIVYWLKQATTLTPS